MLSETLPRRMQTPQQAARAVTALHRHVACQPRAGPSSHTRAAEVLGPERVAAKPSDGKQRATATAAHGTPWSDRSSDRAPDTGRGAACGRRRIGGAVLAAALRGRAVQERCSWQGTGCCCCCFIVCWSFAGCLWILLLMRSLILCGAACGAAAGASRHRGHSAAVDGSDTVTQRVWLWPTALLDKLTDSLCCVGAAPRRDAMHAQALLLAQTADTHDAPVRPRKLVCCVCVSLLVCRVRLWLSKATCAHRLCFWQRRKREARASARRRTVQTTVARAYRHTRIV